MDNTSTSDSLENKTGAENGLTQLPPIMFPIPVQYFSSFMFAITLPLSITITIIYVKCRKTKFKGDYFKMCISLMVIDIIATAENLLLFLPSFHGTFKSISFLASFGVFSSTLCKNVNQYILLGMGVNRFISIVWPLKATSILTGRVIMYMLIVPWVLGIIQCSPILFSGHDWFQPNVTGKPWVPVPKTMPPPLITMITFMVDQGLRLLVGIIIAALYIIIIIVMVKRRKSTAAAIANSPAQEIQKKKREMKLALQSMIQSTCLVLHAGLFLMLFIGGMGLNIELVIILNVIVEKATFYLDPLVILFMSQETRKYFWGLVTRNSEVFNETNGPVVVHISVQPPSQPQPHIAK